MSLESYFWTVLLSSLLGFGGLGSLPVLRSQLASAGLPSDALILQGLAVGYISPGPNGLYPVAIGYFVDGVPGAVAASAALMIPPLLVLVLERLSARMMHLRRFRAALQSLGLAVVAVVAITSGTVASHAIHTKLGLAMVVAGLVALLRRVPPAVGVGVAIGVGLIANLGLFH
jgi:chromate transporter